MQAYFKDNNTLIINTMIDKNEKDKLISFINNANDVTFKKLFNIEGEISGIMFVKSESPSIEITKGISTVISFNLTDDNNKNIEMSDIISLTLECTNLNEIIFSKTKEDFRFEDNKYYINLSSKDTSVEPGEYGMYLECTTPNYNDKTYIRLLVIEGDAND